jgi:hypothetical protein
VTLRSAHSWTRWRLKRTQRRLAKEQRRLTLLLLMVDSQHLRLKQLEQQLHPLLSASQELMESQQFRLQGKLPPPELLPPIPLSASEEISRLLGLQTPQS